MSRDKPLVWLQRQVKTPPLSRECRREIGGLLRDLQQGIALSMPESRPMPSIGARCHEIRIMDHGTRIFWRLIYRIDLDAIVIIELFAKKTIKTPKNIIETCKRRLRFYDSI